jgi:hypothetical protein
VSHVHALLPPPTHTHLPPRLGSLVAVAVAPTLVRPAVSVCWLGPEGEGAGRASRRGQLGDAAAISPGRSGLIRGASRPGCRDCPGWQQPLAVGHNYSNGSGCVRVLHAGGTPATIGRLGLVVSTNHGSRLWDDRDVDVRDLVDDAVCLVRDRSLLMSCSSRSCCDD